MANPSQTRPRRRGLLPAVLILALAAALLLLLVGLLGSDSVLRFFRYMGLRDKESYGNLTFEGGAGNVCAAFDDGLLVGTENGLILYALDGEQKAMIQGSLPTPVLRVGGEVSLIFSPGSAYAAAVGAGGTVLMDGALSGAFVDAAVSADGYTAYITAESGYKAVATVLNPDWEPIYRFSSRTRYLNACAVSPKGELLAVARLEEEDGLYRSGISLLRTDQALTDLDREAEETVRLELGDQMVYELRFLDKSHLLAVAQDELIFFDTDGTRLGARSMREGRLVDWAVSEKGWVLLAFEQNGGGCQVLTLTAEGELLGELDLSDRVRDLSAAGDYAVLLTETWLQTYDAALSPRDRSWDVLSANQVAARPDGTAILVSNGSAKLFIP